MHHFESQNALDEGQDDRRVDRFPIFKMLDDKGVLHPERIIRIDHLDVQDIGLNNDARSALKTTRYRCLKPADATYPAIAVCVFSAPFLKVPGEQLQAGLVAALHDDHAAVEFDVHDQDVRRESSQELFGALEHVEGGQTLG